MQIQIHGFVSSIHGIDKTDLIDLLEVICIDANSFISKQIGISYVLTYSFRSEESVYIRFNNTGYTLLILHGSFFDNSPDFRLRKLLEFLSKYKYTFKQLDVAFNDDEKCLSMQEIKHWCKFHSDYCSGSLVRNHAPLKVVGGNKIERFQLKPASSKTVYGTIYRQKKTRFIRFELKIKDKKKIEYILNDYSSKNLGQFHDRCKETLIGCINFITYQSKKNRVSSKYVMKPSWAAFIGSDIKKPNWRKIHEEQQNNRIKSEGETAEIKIKRLGNMVKNLVIKLSATHSSDYVTRQLSTQSGMTIKRE